MKTKICPANQWTKIISNFGTGMPKAFSITIESSDGTIEGEYEEIPYFWIFKQKSRKGPLTQHMTFYRKWINGIYKVKFFPKSEISVSIR